MEDFFGGVGPLVNRGTPWRQTNYNYSHIQVDLNAKLRIMRIRNLLKDDDIFDNQDFIEVVVCPKCTRAENKYLL